MQGYLIFLISCFFDNFYIEIVDKKKAPKSAKTKDGGKKIIKTITVFVGN